MISFVFLKKMSMHLEPEKKHKAIDKLEIVYRLILKEKKINICVKNRSVFFIRFYSIWIPKENTKPCIFKA